MDIKWALLVILMKELVCIYIILYRHTPNFTIVKVIDSLKLNPYFDFVIASSLVGCEKPDKLIYEQALNLAGNIRPEDALHIGDDVQK